MGEIPEHSVVECGNGRCLDSTSNQWLTLAAAKAIPPVGGAIMDVVFLA